MNISVTPVRKHCFAWQMLLDSVSDSTLSSKITVTESFYEASSVLEGWFMLKGHATKEKRRN